MRVSDRKDDRLRRVGEKLGNLRSRVVFFGASIVTMLVTDPAAAGDRPTGDIDALVHIRSLSDYVDLEQELRDLHFEHCKMRGRQPVVGGSTGNPSMSFL